MGDYEVQRLEDPARGLVFTTLVRDKVSIEDNGLSLTCSRCPRRISDCCSHIRRLIGAGADGAYLHEFESFLLQVDSIHETVVYRSEDNRRLYVDFQPKDQFHVPIARVSGRIYLCKGGMVPLLERGIGTIRHGEGRRVVLSLVRNLVEALWFQLDVRERICVRVTHSLTAEAAVREAARLLKEESVEEPMYAEMWSLLTRGACITCCTLEDAAASDDESLEVMDDSKPRGRRLWSRRLINDEDEESGFPF